MNGIWEVKDGRFLGKVKNFITNGGFEKGSGRDADYWDGNPVSFEYEDRSTGLIRRQYRDKENFRSGKYSLKFDYNVEPPREGHHMNTYIEIELPPYGRESYVGSAWVNIPKTIVKNSAKPTRSPWGAYIVADFYSRDSSAQMNGDGTRSSQEFGRTTDWKKMEFEWEIFSPGEYYSKFFIYAGGMGSFWVDDVFLGLAKHNISIAGETWWDDYIVEARVNLNQRPGSNKCAGIIFRYANCDNFYLLTLEEKSDALKLWENKDGALRSITSGSVPIDVNTEYLVRIRSQGENIIVSLDEKEIVSTTRDTFSSGKIGLWVYGDNTPEFDNIKVYDLKR
jgi:hypothetical protein